MSGTAIFYNKVANKSTSGKYFVKSCVWVIAIGLVFYVFQPLLLHQRFISLVKLPNISSWSLLYCDHSIRPRGHELLFTNIDWLPVSPISCIFTFSVLFYRHYLFIILTTWELRHALRPRGNSSHPIFVKIVSILSSKTVRNTHHFNAFSSGIQDFCPALSVYIN